jgi:hypothetical protein
MPLRHVCIHARLVSLANVPMDYFAFQVLRAMIRGPSSVVQPGKKQHLHVRCLAKVVRVLIVLTARNASVTRHALSLILFIVARALMKLLRRVQILAQVVLTQSVLEARHVTNIHHVAILRHRKRTFLMIRITVAKHLMMQKENVLHLVHQGRRRNVQLVNRVLPIQHVRCSTRKPFSVGLRSMTQAPVRCLVKMAYVLMAVAAMRTLPVLVTLLPSRNQSKNPSPKSLSLLFPSSLITAV